MLNLSKNEAFEISKKASFSNIGTKQDPRRQKYENSPVQKGFRQCLPRAQTQMHSLTMRSTAMCPCQLKRM